MLFRKHQFKGVVEFKDVFYLRKIVLPALLQAICFPLRWVAVWLLQVLALDQITKKTVASGYQLQTLIHEVVQSAPFVSRPKVKTASANSHKHGIKKTP